MLGAAALNPLGVLVVFGTWVVALGLFGSLRTWRTLALLSAGTALYFLTALALPAFPYGPAVVWAAVILPLLFANSLFSSRPPGLWDFWEAFSDADRRLREVIAELANEQIDRRQAAAKLGALAREVSTLRAPSNEWTGLRGLRNALAAWDQFDCSRVTGRVVEQRVRRTASLPAPFPRASGGGRPGGAKGVVGGSATQAPDRQN